MCVDVYPIITCNIPCTLQNVQRPILGSIVLGVKGGTSAAKTYPLSGGRLQESVITGLNLDPTKPLQFRVLHEDGTCGGYIRVSASTKDGSIGPFNDAMVVQLRGTVADVIPNFTWKDCMASMHTRKPLTPVRRQGHRTRSDKSPFK